MKGFLKNKNFTYTVHRLVSILDFHADTILLKEFGFTYNDFSIMAILCEAKEISQANLAKKSGLTNAAISKKMKNFLLRNLIVMKPDSTKKKRYVISLTKNSLKSFTKAANLLEEYFNASIPISLKDELIVTSSVVHKLTEHFSSVVVGVGRIKK
jgi:DNA-binding MarR family transcriptional regulator